MENSQIAKLLTFKGQIVTLTASRKVKVKKGNPDIIKTSRFQCRLGVNYDNMASVNVKRENGEIPLENQGLPYGKWVTFPYIIEHKGQFYLRCSKVNSGNTFAPEFTIAGKPVDRETVKSMALASEFSDKSELDVFNIKLDSITSINGVS